VCAAAASDFGSATAPFEQGFGLGCRAKLALYRVLADMLGVATLMTRLADPAFPPTFSCSADHDERLWWPSAYDLLFMSLMHFERKERRALPWRPLSLACFEHSSDAALRGFSAGLVVCASAAPAQTKLATAAIVRVRMGDPFAEWG
jgi:hypothetical protein